jgi:hypothetical protein
VVAPGATATAFSITPTAQWHIPTATITQSGGRAQTIKDTTGTITLSEFSAGIGGFLDNDAYGRTWLGADGNERMVETSLAVSSTNLLVIAVIRNPKNPLEADLLSLGTGAGALNTVGCFAQVNCGATGAAPTLKLANKLATLPTSGDKSKMVSGAQPHVVAYWSGAASSRMFVNNDFVDTAVITAASGTGFELFTYSLTPGNSYSTGTTANATHWFQGQVLELALFTGVTSAQAVTLVGQMVSNHYIPTITERLVTFLDSLTAGIIVAGNVGVRGRFSIAAQMTLPGGADSVPNNICVLNMGVQGDKVTTWTATKREQANSPWAAIMIPAGVTIKAVLQGGYNDMATDTAATVYSNIVALINTTTTGLMQRGVGVTVMTNIASNVAGRQAKIDALRTSLLDPQFQIDCGVAVQVLDAHDIKVAGVSVCAVAADATNTTYYQTDAIHENELLAGLMAAAYKVAA